MLMQKLWRFQKNTTWIFECQPNKDDIWLFKNYIGSLPICIENVEIEYLTNKTMIKQKFSSKKRSFAQV